MKLSTNELSDRYRAFAHREAHGVSATYESYAISAADNSDLLDRLLKLPDGKQQPHLLFAATRHTVGFPDAGFDFARHVLDAWDDIYPSFSPVPHKRTSWVAAPVSFRRSRRSKDP